jgi:hypothetical protein
MHGLNLHPAPGDPWWYETDDGPHLTEDALALLFGLPSTDALRIELQAQSNAGARTTTIPPDWISQGQRTVHAAIQATGSDDSRVVLDYLAAARDHQPLDLTEEQP